VDLRAWGLQIVDSMRGICELLDEGDVQRPYTAALELQEAKLRDPELTPSARTLKDMRDNEESFFRFALRMSKTHKQYFLETYSPNESRQDEFAAEAEESLAEQGRIEASDTISFDEYLARYMAG
jgi:glutamate--cysteine ligase